MTRPLVSVIMPVYNEEKLVGRAIKSVLNQTLEDLELIIVDDGSTDNTPEILQEFQELDERIRVTRNRRNIGITPSLNRGLKLSRGRYIARIDADDWYRAEKLEVQARFMEDNEEYGIVGTFYILVRPGGGYIKVRLPISHESILKRMAYRNAFCHSCVMIRKRILDEVGYYDESLRYAQDYDLFFRIISISKAANIPQYLCFRTERRFSKKRMIERTLNSIRIPLRHRRVLGIYSIYYILLLRRILTLIRILVAPGASDKLRNC